MYDILLEYVSNIYVGPVQVIAGAILKSDWQTGRLVQVIEPRGTYLRVMISYYGATAVDIFKLIDSSVVSQYSDKYAVMH